MQPRHPHKAIGQEWGETFCPCIWSLCQILTQKWSSMTAKKVKSSALKGEAGEMVKTAIYFWIIKETRLIKGAEYFEICWRGEKIRDGGLFLSTAVMACGLVGQLETSPYQLDNKSITLSYIYTGTKTILELNGSVEPEPLKAVSYCIWSSQTLHRPPTLQQTIGGLFTISIPVLFAVGCGPTLWPNSYKFVGQTITNLRNMTF